MPKKALTYRWQGYRQAERERGRRIPVCIRLPNGKLWHTNAWIARGLPSRMHVK